MRVSIHDNKTILQQGFKSSKHQDYLKVNT